jgi:hypothetical protein
MDKEHWDWPKHDLYVVCRYRKSGERYGKVHMAEDSQRTLCGLDINEHWWIGYSDDYKVTCPKCLCEYRTERNVNDS